MLRALLCCVTNIRQTAWLTNRETASIGVNLVASTTATGLALVREHAAITAMTAAQKSAINVACAATLVNLAADLTGRNTVGSLDAAIASNNRCTVCLPLAAFSGCSLRTSGLWPQS